MGQLVIAAGNPLGLAVPINAIPRRIISALMADRRARRVRRGLVRRAAAHKSWST